MQQLTSGVFLTTLNLVLNYEGLKPLIAEMDLNTKVEERLQHCNRKICNTGVLCGSCVLSVDV